MRLFVLVAAMLLFGWRAFGQAPDLATAKFQHDAAITVIHATRMDGEKNLAAQYTNALNTLRVRAQSDGDLDKLKLVLAEIARFGREQAAPAEPPASADLQNLAAALAKRSREIQFKSAADVLKQAQQFDATLATLQTTLTKQGKIEEATTVQDERKSLAVSDAVIQARKITAQTAAKEPAVAPRMSEPPASPVRPAGVPSEAVQFRNSWFHFYEEDIGWLEAKRKCEKLGGNLAIVPDAETWKFLNAHIDGRHLWLGATMRGFRHEWT